MEKKSERTAFIGDEIEIWKAIPGYEGIYEASTLGRIRSLDRISDHPYSGTITLRGRLKKFTLDKDGYLTTGLFKDGVSRKLGVHQIIAMTFLDHIPNGNQIQVDHKNKIKIDNRKVNLQILTAAQHVQKDGLKSYSKERCQRISNKMKEVWKKRREKFISE